MRDPRTISQHVNEFVAELLATDRAERLEPYVVIEHPTAVVIALPWGGEDPGAFTIRFEARLGEDGSPRLHVESSDELPPQIRRDRIRLED